ncbi:hypothetical protein DFAR_2910052 [Desulfarculales bacterium]
MAPSSAYSRSPQYLVETVEGLVVALSLCYTLVSESGQPPELIRRWRRYCAATFGADPPTRA